MKKFFAALAVSAAFVAAGCAERDQTAPPATDQAAPGETPPADTAPADGTETPNP